MDAGRRNNPESRVKETLFNIGDLSVGPAGKVALITNFKIGSYTLNIDEYRIFGYVNGENVQSFVAYENDIKNMIIAGIWKRYQVVE